MNDMASSEADLPREVLEVLEERCGSEAFLNAYASVKKKAREKREVRKREMAAENVRDPEAAAKRKIWKQEKEKRRRKRRVEGRKASRGVFGKKPRF